MRKLRMRGWPRRHGEAGFTVLELTCVMAMLGVLAAISVGGLRGWSQAREHAGTAAAIQSVLREAQQRAVTEGRATCVDFAVAAQTYTVYRATCESIDPSTRPVEGPLSTDAHHVRIADPAFGPSGSGSGVTFKPRGTASGGSVTVLRDGSATVYTVSVDALTGRISRA
jgi:prepilin-type N-terminal cleavage/methylation domain-containing protein